MKFILFYLQFINSFEGLGMFFSSATLIRRLRRYAVTESPFNFILVTDVFIQSITFLVQKLYYHLN